jgi:hypothetical protein
MKQQEKIPDLNGITGKELPFVVPDSYFDDLPGRIQARLTLPRKSPRKLSLPAFRPALAMAALFMGLIAVGYAGFRILSQRGNDRYLSGEELDATMQYIAYDLDDDMLVSTLVESGISLAPRTADDRTEEIIQILSEEDLNYNDLINDY